LQVLYVLGRIGPGAEEAVSDLINLFEQAVKVETKMGKAQLVLDPLFDRAVDTLAKIGKAAVTKLCYAAVTETKTPIRIGAIRALGEMGYEAKSTKVLQLLVSLVQAQREDPQVQEAAKAAYGKIESSKPKPPKRKAKSKNPSPPPKTSKTY
jgi:HEAT repeat protein